MAKAIMRVGRRCVWFRFEGLSNRLHTLRITVQSGGVRKEPAATVP